MGELGVKQTPRLGVSGYKKLSVTEGLRPRDLLSKPWRSGVDRIEPEVLGGTSCNRGLDSLI